jgi:hypothetical protein
MMFYLDLARTFSYTITEIDNQELALLLDVLNMSKHKEEEQSKPKKVYIDEIL